MPNYAPFAYPPKVVEVKDAYTEPANSPEKIPAGYETTGEFRIPLKGEYYLWCNRESRVTDSHEEPRLIVRPVPVYSDSDILDFMIYRIQNYNLGGCINDIYQDVGWESADKFNRNAISAAMRRQKWPHKSS